MGTNRFSAKTLLGQSLITWFAVSPDAETIVFARRTIEGERNKARLWRVSTSGGRPTQLTFTDGVDAGPVFSPDSSRIAFTSTRGDGKPEPYVLSLDGGEAKRIPGFSGGAAGLDWSPDGKKLLVLAPSGEQRYIVGDPKDPTARVVPHLFWRFDGEGVLDQATSIWVASANGRGKPTRVTGPDDFVGAARWSPDGTRIAFTADLTATRHEQPWAQLWSIPAAGGRARRLSAPDRVVTSFDWSVHGLAYTAWDAPVPVWQDIDLFAVRGRRHVQLAEGLFFESVGWSELVGGGPERPVVQTDGSVVAIASKEGVSAPWRIAPDGSATRLAEGELTCTGIQVAQGRVFVLASVDGAGTDVYEATGDGLRSITKERRWFAPYHQASEPIEIPAKGRAPAVAGWLDTAGRGRRPLVFQIHGGPYGAVGPTPRMDIVALRDAGINVIRLNARGSVTYGEPFAETLHGRWGVPDGEDLLRALDWAVANGIANRDRIGLLGLSYGGYMVHHLLGSFPGRFAAAVSENPFSDAFADLGAGDSAAYLEPGVGLPPWPTGLDAWMAHSPFMRLHRNTAPILFLQAEADLRCPPVNTDVTFGIMQLKGVPSEMVRYPDEAHVMLSTGRPDRRVDRIERIVAWFKRYL